MRNSTPALDVLSDTMSLRDRLDLRFAHRLERKAAVAAQATIANTATHKALIEDLYTGLDSERHHIVSLALAPDLLEQGAATPWPPAVSHGQARSIVFVGRAERRKGYREALGGFARACAALPPADCPVLHVVGMDDAQIDVDRELVDALATVRDRITFHPKVSDALLYDLYRQAWAVLAPSRYESFGLVYREAAAFGRPLIACAEDPAAVEFIAASNCGLLAEACTSDAVGSVMVDILTDDARCAAFHANGKNHVKTLTRKRLAAETLAVYERALAEAGRSQTS